MYSIPSKHISQESEVLYHLLPQGLCALPLTIRQLTNITPPHSTSCITNGARLTHYFALFWGLGLLLEYLATCTSGAKSDTIFLLGDFDFL